MSVIWVHAVKIEDKIYAEGFCESSDDKPLTIIDKKTQQEFELLGGTNLIENDTGDWYFLNETDHEYKSLANLGG